VPKWNNIYIEQNLRKFISLTSKVKGFEKFFNLNRNEKYRNLDVDWTTTFQLLHTDIESTSTDFTSSKIKEKKVKLLIEELSTIEQLKKSFMNIYENMLCPFCDEEEETFDHVWTCNERDLEMLDIITSYRKLIIDLINEQLENNHVTLNNLDALGSTWRIRKLDMNSLS
jgi:hypothetical protein